MPERSGLRAAASGDLPGRPMPGGAPRNDRRRHDHDTPPPPSTRTPSTDVLGVLLDDVLLDVADDAGDRYSSRTPAGRALLSLAALDRRAAGALGVDPGVALTSGPGIVVQRELAAAARLLDEALAAADGEPDEAAGLLVPAQRLHAHLLEALAATGR